MNSNDYELVPEAPALVKVVSTYAFYTVSIIFIVMSVASFFYS